jgi:hypothetical protein
MAAKEERRTTRWTEGAKRATEERRLVVPRMAGFRTSRWMLLREWFSGLAVWMTASKGGVDWTAASKALGWEISGTMEKVSWVGDAVGCCDWIRVALEWLRTVVTTV